MRREGLALLFVLLAAAPVHGKDDGAERDVGAGPLSMRSSFALEMLLPSHEALAPRVEDRGEIRLDLRVQHANVLARGGDVKGRREIDRTGGEQPPGYDILVDTEVTRLSTEVAVGVGARWELALTAAAIGYTGGFLDGIIDEFHGAFGLPNDNRDQRPEDEVGIAVLGDRGVLDWDESPTGLSLADTLISARRILREEGTGGPAVLLELALEIPTGDEDRLTGSGDWDGRLSVHGSEGWRDTHFMTWGVSRVFAGDYEAAPLPVGDAWHGHIGYEFYRAGWSVPVQVVLTDSHFGEGEGDDKIDDYRALLQAGVRREGPRWGWDVGFSQNLTLHDNNADLAISAGLRWRIGAVRKQPANEALRRGGNS